MILAERIRKTVEDFVFKGSAEIPEIKVAINVGVAVFPDHGKNSDEMLSMAQRSLVMARDQGGNMVKLYPDVLYAREQ